MDKVLILNFGGQYDQLIARRVRESGLYCEIYPYNASIDRIKEFSPTALIFTGGPKSVYLEDSPHLDKELFELNIPILGICYGCQLIAYELGGVVKSGKEEDASEYGKVMVNFDNDNKLFSNVPTKSVVWMSHQDRITVLPQGFKAIAKSDKCPIAAICDEKRKIYGVQFHPEVTHTEYGKDIIKSFLYEVCELKPTWSMKSYKDVLIEDIKKKVGNGKVLLALSGGVDSSVAARLLEEAIGENLVCVFVDHGLMRLNEGDLIEETFSKGKIRFIRINASDRFLSALKGVTEPEQKRKIIGREFIKVFESVKKEIGEIDYLAQGTIYPDVIESGKGEAETIKSHHNVGGLPSIIDFKGIIEPLRLLFKDEVRELGKELGLSDAIVYRQPFPGPGLGIRIIGEITKEKLDILRHADSIFTSEMEKNGFTSLSNQYFAVLTNLKSVGVMGDGRTYENALVLRAVTTEDFMTCSWTRLPYEFLDKVALRIVNEVKGINRVLYDITGKPPATVEFE